jgi:hypothetical protein
MNLHLPPVNFFIFWAIMIGLFIAIFYGGDKPFVIIYRIVSMLAILFFILYFALGAQPRMWG